MANFRIPRGYEATRRPGYQEISEGVRPEVSAVPLEAWTGLSPVRVDELHDDPIVIDAGTVIGIATGGLAVGKAFPAHNIATGGGLDGTDATLGGVGNNLTFKFSSDDQTKWGIALNETQSVATVTAGPVKPLGVCYQPIYSFQLQNTFINYTRNVNVGFVTDYMIQVPVLTAEEGEINAGDLVMINNTATEYGRIADLSSPSQLMGRYKKWDGTASFLDLVVGKCINRVTFATGTAAATLASDIDNISLTTAGQAEFKDLDKVQTVPGLGLSGSGTKGVPAWLTKAVADGAGNYDFLTILVRL